MISRMMIAFSLVFFPLFLLAAQTEQDNLFAKHFMRQDLKKYPANYKVFLRQLLSVDLNSRFQVGLDRFKVGPLESNIIETKIASGSLARGYGVELRMKMD